MANKFVVWFEEIGKEDGALVGGKGANLGEMVQFGIPVPPGFIVTSEAYYLFLAKTRLKTHIGELLKDLDVANPEALTRVSKSIKQAITSKPMPKEIAQEIVHYYLDLALRDAQIYKNKHKITEKIKQLFQLPLVAVRSSATAEDLPGASFAGQQATFLNIKGEIELVEKVKECWASLFEPRAIFYRHEQKFDHFKVGIAVPVEKMIQSEVSGVMFTVDPVTGDKKKIVVEAIYGLGEYIVQGVVSPDHYEVDKKKLEIIHKSVCKQERKLTLAAGGQHVRDEIVSQKERSKQKISDKQIVEVAKLGKKIEEHYYFPQDIEWAMEAGRVYIVQTRPVTTLGEAYRTKLKADHDVAEVTLPTILTGDPASPGVVSGPVKIVMKAAQIGRVKQGDVLVAPQTNPDYVPAMRRAGAIVTERGGRTSHAAIVSRELGLPAVVGAAEATTKLKDGLVVTVDGALGKVYRGGLLQDQRSKIKDQKNHSLTNNLKTATKVYVNLAEPSRAMDVAKRNVDGIGLLRAEFMIADIGYHPKKLLAEKRETFFIDKLTEKLQQFCDAFSPRPVVYRATDFKTNEYRNLKGGKQYEPEESNPMLGFRGAYRYIADPQVFEMELAALKAVRTQKNLRNLWLMIPFVRTPEELSQIKKIVSAAGLLQSHDFKLWMMVELPINVILLDEFLDVGIDGVSIGSNDLTMLIMGTDRDNSEVASLFNERNPAVLWALEKVITTCHRRGVTSSICGQAPSDYPELVEKLVQWGITSVSVNPDAIERVRETIHEVETKLVIHKQ